jgi:hypothetical protein
VPPRRRAAPGPADGGDGATLVRFAGPPARVQALLQRPVEELADVVVTVELAGGAVDVPAVAVAAGPGHAAVRLMPTEPLPPGRHPARLVVGKETRDAEVEVLGQERARAYPTEVHLEAAGGAEAEVRVDLLNAGNVPVEIRSTYAVPLEETDALERAIVAGMTSDEGGIQRWGAAADALADSQSGVARLAVQGGAGALAPGESRRLVAVVRLPDALPAGGTHEGIWRVGTAGVRLVVRAAAPALPPSPGAVADVR